MTSNSEGQREPLRTPYMLLVEIKFVYMSIAVGSTLTLVVGSAVLQVPPFAEPFCLFVNIDGFKIKKNLKKVYGKKDG